jgi:hypothetical protein
MTTTHNAGFASDLSAASRELYEAELALHDARSSGVDAWVSAASDHLHRALERYVGQLHAINGPTAA